MSDYIDISDDELNCELNDLNNNNNNNNNCINNNVNKNKNVKYKIGLTMMFGKCWIFFQKKIHFFTFKMLLVLQQIVY